MKCEKCNVEMIEGRITGQHPFEFGVDGRTDISIKASTGEQGKFLGIKYDKEESYGIKTYSCPNCKKIEFYLDDDNQ